MKILILGGGVSGLSAAWFARQKWPKAQITLLEKEGRLGGLIETRRMPFLFEKGPRTFPLSRSSHLLDLIRQVGLEKDLLFSAPAKRYLWHKKKLRSFASLFPSLFFPLLKEPFLQKGGKEEESVYEFAERRLGPRAAELLFDPMALGIYAGDIRKLSLRSCFPFLVQREGALWSVFLRTARSRLFTLRGGIESLIEALQKVLPIEICLNCPVEKIEENKVFAKGGSWEGDLLFSALPAPVLGTLTGEGFAYSAASLWVVHLAFLQSPLVKRGFGYLVPTREGEAVLGAIWDSSLFPSDASSETRLTFMVRNRGDEKWACAVALEAAQRHLAIKEKPAFCEAHLASEAIPQFEVGYAKRLTTFQVQLKKRFPSLILAGNYLAGGASVEACIASAKKAVAILGEGYAQEVSE